MAMDLIKPQPKMDKDVCDVCGEKNITKDHYVTEKHKRNQSLKDLSANKSQFITQQKDTVSVSCDVSSSFSAVTGNREPKIDISTKPNEEVVFKFRISNDSDQDMYILNIKLVHSKFNFVMNNHSFQMGGIPKRLPPKSKLAEEITVKFSSNVIGQYQTPIMFYFQRAANDTIAILKDMVVYVESHQIEHESVKGPFENKQVWAKTLFKSAASDRSGDQFRIPKNCKRIFANSLEAPEDADDDEKNLTQDLRKVFNIGVTKENYIKFFHNLLWYEETVIRANIKRYNMTGVKLTQQHLIHSGTCYALVVPGLAEKRPSLMSGDLLFIKPHNQLEIMFEAIVKEINENTATVGKLHESFVQHYKPDALFDVRFFMSRIPLERMHYAVNEVIQQEQVHRIFPQESKKVSNIQPIVNFFNPLVEDNLEQRCAVERIVSGTSGTAPFLLHGPPGTGKTVTIVEAILQLVHRNSRNRIMVCTDSNMAADHVATMIIKYLHLVQADKPLLRANSKFRIWETLPECLAKYSNGTCRQNFEPISIQDFMSYNIVITTLSHAAKFARQLKSRRLSRHISHLFIDEAAQACEPACLIPVCGLLAPAASLVLAGDPHQLGPVVISHKAAKLGLGTSLMERLQKTCALYSDNRNDKNYIVMLRNNFRSHTDILDIPDKLFYNGQLRAFAKEDHISAIDILGEKKESRAVVFHGVLSKEQKIGKSPSYFNMMECEMVVMYVKRLVTVHKVFMEDIGIVTPYIRQVYQIKKSLKDLGYDKIEVGTVEAYQGKEKRVIIISTVRANCNLLDHDAKFQLGFLVDDKRFNVALTRAKAKAVIIGNPLCLQKDIKWRQYMQKCRELGTYHGFDSAIMDEESSKQIIQDLAPLLNELHLKKASKKIENGH